MTDENKQALKALNDIIQRKNDNPITDQEFELLEGVYKSYKAALQLKPSVDVEVLKVDIYNIFVGSEDIDKSQWDIADEAVDYLHSQGHLNQGWRDE